MMNATTIDGISEENFETDEKDEKRNGEQANKSAGEDEEDDEETDPKLEQHQRTVDASPKKMKQLKLVVFSLIFFFYFLPNSFVSRKSRRSFRRRYVYAFSTCFGSYFTVESIYFSIGIDETSNISCVFRTVNCNPHTNSSS
jgi:hypothetical protein